MCVCVYVCIYVCVVLYVRKIIDIDRFLIILQYLVLHELTK